MKEDYGFRNRQGYGDALQGHPDKLIGTKTLHHLIGKTVKTKGGMDVRIIAFEPELEQPIVGILNGQLDSWEKDGKYWHRSDLLDLVLE
jgi:hypothetical protein